MAVTASSYRGPGSPLADHSVLGFIFHPSISAHWLRPRPRPRPRVSLELRLTGTTLTPRSVAGYPLACLPVHRSPVFTRAADPPGGQPAGRPAYFGLSPGLPLSDLAFSLPISANRDQSSIPSFSHSKLRRDHFQSSRSLINLANRNSSVASPTVIIISRLLNPVVTPLIFVRLRFQLTSFIYLIPSCHIVPSLPISLHTVIGGALDWRTSVLPNRS